jgi:hypothetical protein
LKIEPSSYNQRNWPQGQNTDIPFMSSRYSDAAEDTAQSY